MTQNTPRKRMSAKRRHHIFSEHCTAHHVAPCCLCGKPIHRHRDRWIIEHIRALALLGDDINTNCGPAHYECGIEKSAREARIIAKAKRQARTLANLSTLKAPIPRTPRRIYHCG
jgi:hypothetical protein